jgi:hypothetical protein
MKPRVCILSFSDIAWDARVLREIEAASEKYDVDVIGYGNWQAVRENVRFLSMSRSKTNIASVLSKYVRGTLGYLYPGQWEKHFWQKQEYRQVFDILLREEYDLIHANDWDALPVAARAVQQVGGRLLFDAHEYTPAQSADRLMVRLFNLPGRVHLFKTYQKWITKTITVSNGLKNLYHDNFGWSSDVIMNAPYYVKSEFRAVDADEIHLVHHGAAIRSRHLEDLIHLMEFVEPRFILDFILLPSEPRYPAQLELLAGKIAPARIRFHKAVPPGNLNRELVKFDIGMPWLRANNLNHINALPNKFFSYVMAGLGVAIPPLPSMRKIVDEYGVGVVAADLSIQKMAAALNNLTADRINQFKQNSLELAQTLNAEREMEKLMGIYGELLK